MASDSPMLSYLPDFGGVFVPLCPLSPAFPHSCGICGVNPHLMNVYFLLLTLLRIWPNLLNGNWTAATETHTHRFASAIFQAEFTIFLSNMTHTCEFISHFSWPECHVFHFTVRQILPGSLCWYFKSLWFLSFWHLTVTVIQSRNRSNTQWPKQLKIYHQHQRVKGNKKGYMEWNTFSPFSFKMIQ